MVNLGNIVAIVLCYVKKTVLFNLMPPIYNVGNYVLILNSIRNHLNSICQEWHVND